MAKKYLDKDTYPFRDPAEVRVILKILPKKTSEVGLEGEDFALATNLFLGLGP